MVTDERRPVTAEKSSHKCNNCVGVADENKLQACSGCRSVTYCSSKCQKQHWRQHKVLCNAIQFLAKKQEDDCRKKCEYMSHLDPEQHRQVVDLVGRRCIVHCKIGGIEVKSLWDTGSQVSLISLAWLTRHFKDFKIKSIKDLLGDEIDLEAVGGKRIPYVGYVLLTFTMGNANLDVPFLVTSEKILQPILGFNIISSLAKADDLSARAMTDDFRKSFKDIDDEKIKALVSFLETQEPRRLATVTTYKQGAIIRKNSEISIPCKVQGCTVDRRLPVVFEPNPDFSLDEGLVVNEAVLTLKAGPTPRVFITITNNCNYDILLPGKTCLGELHLVASVTPAEVTFKEFDGRSEETDKDSSVNLTEESKKVIRTEANETRTKDTSQTEPIQVCEVDVGCVEKVKPSEKFLKELDAMDMTMLSEEQRAAARKMIVENSESFAQHEDDIGDASELQMNINTTDEAPVQRSYNAIPKPLYAEVKNHIQNLLNRGWITHSKSSWASPVVVVRKKNGEMRLCVDFRLLNNKTIKDKHPLPKVQHTIDNLSGSTWFTTLDQSKAYYQGYISEESRKKTAFVSPVGFFEFVRIPFGLSNAPSAFQRYMQQTLSDFNEDFVIPYIDDVIIFSNNFDDHLLHIQKVLQRLRSKGLKLKLEKCEFFKREVHFLGRVVGQNGYRMDERSVAAVTAMKHFTPKNVGQIRQILGLISYHRRHIQDFATIAKPLTDLLHTEPERKESKKTKRNSKKNSNCVPSSKPVIWEAVHRETLDKLIDMVTTAPILAYPDYSEKFFLHTDASGIGLGCILYQEQRGKVRVLGYGSRTLKPAESNYHSSKLEFLALRWAVTEHFKDYLSYADHFEVMTDNNPLTYLMENSKVNATTQRWVSELADFNFSIHYRPGVVHKDADCLSRLPLDFEIYKQLCTEHANLDKVEAIVSGIKVQERNMEAWIPSEIDVQSVSANRSSSKVSLDSLKEAQRNDPIISPIIELLRDRSKKWNDANLSHDSKLLMKERKRLYFNQDDIICRRSGKRSQIVLPKSYHSLIYKQLHQLMGHPSTERTFQLARQRVYWPRMRSNIDEFIHGKCRCIIQKKPNVKSFAPLQSVHSSSPMELVAIDFLHLEKSSAGHNYILLITDHFTRFSQAYATRNKSASVAAKKLFDDFILRFGLPWRIMHDQGGEFENRLFSELERLTGIDKSRTTPYHPQTNGAVERMNATLLGMLRTLPETSKSKWHEALNKMIFAYNSTCHESTGFSPHFLLFGREPVLPIDIILGIDDSIHTTDYTQFANSWRQQMEDAYHAADERSRKSKSSQEKRWEKKPLLTCLKENDYVLVKNTETGGPGKLRSFWEPVLYKVKEVGGSGDVVHSVQRADGQGRVRVLHRNMLMPCSESLAKELLEDLEKEDHIDKRSERKIQTRAQRKKHEGKEKLESDSESDTAEGLDPNQLSALQDILVDEKSQNEHDLDLRIEKGMNERKRREVKERKRIKRSAKNYENEIEEGNNKKKIIKEVRIQDVEDKREEEKERDESLEKEVEDEECDEEEVEKEEIQNEQILNERKVVDKEEIVIENEKCDEEEVEKEERQNEKEEKNEKEARQNEQIQNEEEVTDIEEIEIESERENEREKDQLGAKDAEDHEDDNDSTPTCSIANAESTDVQDSGVRTRGTQQRKPPGRLAYYWPGESYVNALLSTGDVSPMTASQRAAGAGQMGISWGQSSNETSENTFWDHNQLRNQLSRQSLASHYMQPRVLFSNDDRQPRVIVHDE